MSQNRKSKSREQVWIARSRRVDLLRGQAPKMRAADGLPRLSGLKKLGPNILTFSTRVTNTNTTEQLLERRCSFHRPPPTPPPHLRELISTASTTNVRYHSAEDPYSEQPCWKLASQTIQSRDRITWYNHEPLLVVNIEIVFNSCRITPWNPRWL